MAAIIVIGALVLSGMLGLQVESTSTPPSPPLFKEDPFEQETRIMEDFQSKDGFFTENQGQIEEDSVKYYIQGQDVWFLDDGVVFDIKETVDIESAIDQFNIPGLRPYQIPGMPGYAQEPVEQRGVVIRLHFEDCNDVVPEGREMLPHKSNYFYGNDSKQWRTGIPNFQEVIYRDIYDGIDLRYHTNEHGLKYDFIVHPGANVEQIKMKWEGIEDLYVDHNGDLIINTSIGEIVDSDLNIYQANEDNCNSVEGRIRLLDGRTYGFEITEEYDHDTILVIDPLIYSTFMGAIANDSMADMEIDTAGYAYVCGRTDSTFFTTTIGAYDTTHNGDPFFNLDAVIFKLNAEGEALIYSTFIGGSAKDECGGIAVDDSGSVFITGQTTSPDFPVTSGAYDTSFDDSISTGYEDAYVLKLNQSGTGIYYCTYIGGSNQEFPHDITIDSIGCAYVAGSTTSPNFPTTPNAYDTSYNNHDTIVFKLNAGGSSLVYSSFIGGSTWQFAIDIELDSQRNAYVYAMTASQDFPTTSGAYNRNFNGGWTDSVLFKFNSGGTDLVFSTFIGGNDKDNPADMELDENLNILVTGSTNSTDIPFTTSSYDPSYNGGLDGYIIKMDPTASTVLYSTYLGGSKDDSISDIEIDESQNLILCGLTNSSNFPFTWDAISTVLNKGNDLSNYDGFICKFDMTNSVVMFSTYLGGSSIDWCNSNEIDDNGNVYTCGGTFSQDFPVTASAVSCTHNGQLDMFVLRLSILPNQVAQVIDLNISEALVYRTNEVEIYSNASDIEDYEEQLTPYFMYKSTSDTEWRDDYFSDPVYRVSRWESTFTPQKTATLGAYDLKVRYQDKALDFSNWFILNESLFVMNNLPAVENIQVSKEEAVLEESLSIWVDATDQEDIEMNLSMELEYRDPNEHSWNISYPNNPVFTNERWEYPFKIPKESPLGYYDFRARCKDSDNDQCSWYYVNDSLLVKNLAPEVIDMEVSKNKVYRCESVLITVNGEDLETEEKHLKFYVQYRHDEAIDWEDLKGDYSLSKQRWETGFTPSVQAPVGIYHFRARCVDQGYSSSTWFYRNDSLEVMNNLPIYMDFSISSLSVFRTETITIFANGTDIEDAQDQLTCSIQIKSLIDDWIDLSDVIFENDHWSGTFTPTIESTLGDYYIRINFTDADGGFSDWTLIKNAFAVENNPPVILETCDNFTLDTHIVDIHLTEHGHDIEDTDESLTWLIDHDTINPSLFSASIYGETEDIIRFISKKNVTGTDDITLMLKDSDGAFSTKTDVTVRINSIQGNNVDITVSPNTINVFPGQISVVAVEVTNLGMFTGGYNLGFESDVFDEANILFEREFILLGPSKTQIVNVTIQIPQNAQKGTNSIDFKAFSDSSSSSATLNINVLKSAEKMKDIENTSDFSLQILLTIIILIVIIVVSLYVLRKKSSTKKPRSSDLDESEYIGRTSKPIEVKNLQRSHPSVNYRQFPTSRVNIQTSQNTHQPSGTGGTDQQIQGLSGTKTTVDSVLSGTGITSSERLLPAVDTTPPQGSQIPVPTTKPAQTDLGQSTSTKLDEMSHSQYKNQIRVNVPSAQVQEPLTWNLPDKQSEQ